MNDLPGTEPKEEVCLIGMKGDAQRRMEILWETRGVESIELASLRERKTGILIVLLSLSLSAVGNGTLDLF